MIADEHGDKIVVFLHEMSHLSEFSQWLTTNYSPGDTIKIYIEGRVVESNTQVPKSHSFGIIQPPEVSETAVLRGMIQKLHLEIKSLKSPSLHQQIMVSGIYLMIVNIKFTSFKSVYQAS